VEKSVTMEMTGVSVMHVHDDKGGCKNEKWTWNKRYGDLFAYLAAYFKALTNEEANLACSTEPNKRRSSNSRLAVSVQNFKLK